MGHTRLEWLSVLLIVAPLTVVHALSLRPRAIPGPSQDQRVLGSQQSAGIHTQSTTLVDLLSADADFSLLLRLVQRARLVPTLNALNGSTFFAPTNDAIKRIQNQTARHPFKLDTPVDNIQAELRATLLYHLLNYTLNDTANANDQVEMHETMLIPSRKAGQGRPGSPGMGDGHDDQLDTRDQYEDDYGWLAGQGQKLFIAPSKTTDKPSPLLVGVSAQGAGGVTSGISRSATNGNLVPLDGVLDPPRNLSQQIVDHPDLAQFRALFGTDELNKRMNHTHLTLFAPSDKAWDALDEYEKRYLASGFAQDDLEKILQHHLSSSKQIGYYAKVKNETLLPTRSGASLALVVNNGVPEVNGSALVDYDILAQNGVMHIVDTLLLPPEDSFTLTPEKYLIALNATRFVALLRSAELSKHVQSSNASMTILAVRDDVLERWESGWDRTLPAQGTRALTEALQYHLVPGKWTSKDLADGMLLPTLLEPDSLDHAPQLITISVSQSESEPASLFSKPKPEKPTDLGFNTASVIASPVVVGNSIIYLISQMLEAPPNVIETAVSDLRLSTFVASVFAADLDKKLKKQPALTFLAPDNDAFRRLGLVMSYLLLPTSRRELVSTLSYHAVRELVYEEDFQPGSNEYMTLEGSGIYIGKNDTGALQIHGPTLSGFRVNGDTRDAHLLESNILTKTGVLHVTDHVVLPPTVSISIDKLMRGGKASTMAELLRLTNLTWVADGSPPPDEASAAMLRKKLNKAPFRRRSYTVLCPTDKAFTALNLTYYLGDIPALTELMKLHIIPSDPPSRSSIAEPRHGFPSGRLPLELADSAVYDTLLSEDDPKSSGRVALRRFAEDSWLVGVDGARGEQGRKDWARILSWGKATPVFATSDDASTGEHDASIQRSRMSFGGGVLLIDSVLLPYRPTFWHKFGWIIVVVILAIIGLTCVGLLAWKLWSSQRAEAYIVLENEED
ncbi:hypothetical protein E5Q_01175 [Mixia osmundae IAM 14324]|uniref:FAS1 domain-containing protein n=2 Tax=Mixia osmundae (strain CBS 9802 / IAM 14324 / JCM 22182 / KY 12970) TaxID=764103 RepID=G7DVB3_MIXOS|nr:hypothetical protein E5Q_01175 [Mixia osmundae IAM 14324]